MYVSALGVIDDSYCVKHVHVGFAVAIFTELNDHEGIITRNVVYGELGHH